MGEAFLSASLQVILDKLASPVLRDFNFRWSIGKKLRKLAVMLSKIQAVLNDAEQKEISDTAVKMWLSDLKDVAYDIEDVVDEFAYEVERSKAKLEHLCDLEEWFVVEEDGKFPCIHQLQIRYCPKLKKLPDCFSALERLEIHWCGGLVVPPRLPALHHLAVISCDDSTLRLLPYLKSLSSLCISGYDKPTSFPEGFLGPLLTPPHATSSSLETSRGFLPTTLQHLVISHCSNLESLSLQNFESLEILEVQGCSKFASFSHDWLPTKLKDLTIIESPIKYLPKGLQNLTSLNNLKMEFCNELESLPEDGLPTSLNHLCLAECKLLSKRCSEEGEDWPKIAHIPQRWIRL
ncbi:hypothetical protein HHK36_027189 [Tetracentron sinense]|uniref:Disease resistance N-terminal domain-containing protein n=1 Tax=Tetracentron sinense TaxID=13715 RepID=A0A834YGE2_TETSI|nr:hypothetical protein HHK36_027189 [Tetracentron sinense]